MSTSSSIPKCDIKRGSMIYDWKVIRKIGSGGFGTVYEVEKGGIRGALKAEIVDQTGKRRETLTNEASPYDTGAPIHSLNCCTIIKAVFRVRSKEAALKQKRYGTDSNFPFIAMDSVPCHSCPFIFMEPIERLFKDICARVSCSEYQPYDWEDGGYYHHYYVKKSDTEKELSD